MPGTVSTHATRLWTTSPLVGIWGANVGFAFASPEIPMAASGPSTRESPRDDAGNCMNPPNFLSKPRPSIRTAYAGVTFWARAESPGGRAVRVQFTDVSTDPRGRICQDTDTG